MRRLFNTNHKRLTAAALVTGALTTVALIGPFSDRTYYCFLVAFIGFSLLAINAGNRQVNQILDEELDPHLDCDRCGGTGRCPVCTPELADDMPADPHCYWCSDGTCTWCDDTSEHTTTDTGETR